MYITPNYIVLLSCLHVKEVAVNLPSHCSTALGVGCFCTGVWMPCRFFFHWDRCQIFFHCRRILMFIINHIQRTQAYVEDRIFKNLFAFYFHLSTDSFVQLLPHLLWWSSLEVNAVAREAMQSSSSILNAQRPSCSNPPWFDGLGFLCFWGWSLNVNGPISESRPFLSCSRLVAPWPLHIGSQDPLDKWNQWSSSLFIYEATVKKLFCTSNVKIILLDCLSYDSFNSNPNIIWVVIWYRSLELDDACVLIKSFLHHI